MTEPRPNSDETCARFARLLWHDSELIGYQVTKDEDAYEYSVRLDLLLYEKNQEGKFVRNPRKVTFKDCRILQTDLDLLGVLLCGGAISYGECHTDAPKHEAEHRGRLQEFDLPEAKNPLDSCLVFHIAMCPPGGEVVIYAKDFQVE